MESLIQRVRNIIDICWSSFSAKVGGELIFVNKEASMQLHFAYILKNTIDLVIQNQDEMVSIELETGILVNSRMRECDIVIRIQKAQETRFLPIEMKCYKEYASSGGKRGAIDIFCKDVYADLELLESYSNEMNYINGIQLTMTDYRQIVFPNHKGVTPKYRDYNIADGAGIVEGIHLSTPIGGKPVSIRLIGSYSFNWNQIGGHYFIMLQNNN